MFNKYKRALATGLFVLGLNGTALSREGNQPQQPAQVEHTLTSTPDAGTTLNEDLAGKVRRLAELMITKERGTFEKLEDEAGIIVTVRRLALNETKGYEFSVLDDNGTLKYATQENEELDVPDNLLIIVSYLTENNQRKTFAFFDYGLDGNVNVAETYVAPTNTLFPPENLTDYEFEEEQLKEVKTFKKDGRTGEVIDGAENQQEFQREYLQAIDELIQIYEHD